MSYDIYTYGNGEILRSIFYAISMCLKSNGGSLHEPLIRLGLILGAFWSIVSVIYSDFSRIFTSWLIPSTVIMALLFVPTVTVHIHDPVTRFHDSVANIPYGLGAFAGYVSKIGYGITEQVEKVFSLPDDLKFQKTGYIFASNLMEKANQFRITNEDMVENMNEFVGQCVLFDALLGRKYTIKDLRHTDDLWGLVSVNASPVRNFMWREPRGERGGGGEASLISCTQGVVKINQLWAKEIDSVTTFIGKKTFAAGGTIDPKVELQKYLPLAYGELTKMTKDATSIIKQQMMIGSIIDSADKQSVAAGNASNFAARRAYLGQRTTYQTLGAMAGDTLPTMKAVLEAIAYSMFIFVIPLALLPFGWRILSAWAQIILWLQMWAPLYAILNYIMTISASSKTLAAMSLSTKGGVTIANSVGMMDANADIGAMAGYLSMSIPFLSIALVKGIGSFVNMASHLGNVSQGAASAASAEMTSGNYSFGNISEGGRSIGNSQMFNQSMAASYKSGAFQMSDGRMDLATMPDGSQVMNVGSSNLPVTINGAKSESDQQSEMASNTYQKGVSLSESSAKHLASSYNAVSNLSKILSNSESAGDSVTKGASSEDTKSIQSSASLIKNFADEKGINVEKAASLFAEASAGGGILIASVSAGGRANVSASGSELLREAKTFSEGKEFQDAYRSAVQASSNLSHTLSDDKTRSLASSIAGSYDQGMQERDEASKNFTQSDAYNKQAMFIESNSSSINANYTQQFAEWLPNQRADGTTGRMGNHAAAHIIANDPKLTSAYASKFMAEKNLTVKSLVIQSSDTIKSSYDNEKGHKVHAVTRDSMNGVRRQGEEQINHSDRMVKAPAMRENVETKIESQSSQVMQKSGELKNSGNEIQHNVQSNQGKYALGRAVKKASDELVELGTDTLNLGEAVYNKIVSE